MKPPDDVAAMKRLHALGWGVRRIARELGISPNTVRHHLRAGEWRPFRAPDRPGGRAGRSLRRGEKTSRAGRLRPARRREDYGGSFGLAREAHTLRLVAVGWEAHLAAVPGQATRSSVLAEGRRLAGLGGWPLRWLGGTAYTGVGFDTITIYEQPALTIPAEAVVFVGGGRFGAEVLVRGDLALTSERRGLDVLGPFDGTYARLAAWVGEKRPKEGGRRCRRSSRWDRRPPATLRPARRRGTVRPRRSKGAFPAGIPRGQGMDVVLQALTTSATQGVRPSGRDEE